MKKWGHYCIAVLLILASILFVSCTADVPVLPKYDSFSPASELDITNLPFAVPTEILDVNSRETIQLTAEIVAKEINGTFYKMYGYNRMIPGVILRVKENATIYVNFTNKIDLNTTIHWHGLRHNVKDDGVPGISQDPVIPGNSHLYTLYFPDAGLYWYHPHIREDIQQDSGLAGNMIVLPINTSAYPLADVESILMLDDMLILPDKTLVYGKKDANYAIMGRYGNVLLVNGETQYTQNASANSVVRLLFTNIANVRPFNLSISGARMKLVGGDLGLYEFQKEVDSIIIAPAERYLVDVLFEKPGTYELYNINPHDKSLVGTFTVSEGVQTSAAKQFLNQSVNTGELRELALAYLNSTPQYTLELSVDLSEVAQEMARIEAGPQGEKIVNRMKEEMAHMGESKEGIEWEDEMPFTNSYFDSSQVKWQIRDNNSRRVNMNFSMSANIGDKVKMRLFNDPDSDHPMQHPIHLHGQRFIVLSDNGILNPNLVWKDTVLVPVGHTVDIVVDVTNPGEWMMHCHIAEHLESGMMTSFIVSESKNETKGMHN